MFLDQTISGKNLRGDQAQMKASKMFGRQVCPAQERCGVRRYALGILGIVDPRRFGIVEVCCSDLNGMVFHEVYRVGKLGTVPFRIDMIDLG